MNITEITTRAGARPKRKRVGRGPGSGLGKTSGYGHKGQGSRSGSRGERGLLSEGGVFPLFRRLPKVGFNNKNFRTEYQVVNLRDLETRCESGSHVTAASLETLGLIRDRTAPVKILGEGEIQKKLTIEAQRFSASAAKKIEAAGGTIKRLGAQPKKKFVKRPAWLKAKETKDAEKAEGTGKGKAGGKKDKGDKSVKAPPKAEGEADQG
jgi:large subunit ribosomal protein L15